LSILFRTDTGKETGFQVVAQAIEPRKRSGLRVVAGIGDAGFRCWGAQAASLQVSAACRDWEMASPRNYVCKDVAGRAAGNYRLAACAPLELSSRLLIGLMYVSVQLPITR